MESLSAPKSFALRPPTDSVIMLRPVSKRQTLQSPCGAVSKIVFPHLPQTRAFVVSALPIRQLLVLQYSAVSMTETVKRLFYGVFGHPQLLRDLGLRRPVRFTDKKLFQSVE